MSSEFKKVSDLIEASLGVAALFGIIVISTVGVLVLNPVRMISPDGNIAGIDTNGGIVLDYVNQYYREDHTLNINEESSLLNYEIVTKDLKKGVIENEFLVFSNPFNRNIKTIATADVIGYSYEDIQISIVDSNGAEYFIFPEKNQLELDIPSYSEESYRIRFYSDKNINFPVKIEVNFNF